MLRLYWEGNFILAGRKDKEILETIEHYQAEGTNIRLPDTPNPIKDIEKIVVFHMLPVARLDQEFAYFEPVEDIGFQVHPNAIIDLLQQSVNYGKSLKGGLYQINPKRDLSRMPPLDKLSDPRTGCCFFLPKDAMEALAHHDWNELLVKYVSGAVEREKTLKHPHPGLNSTLQNNARQLRGE